MWETFRPDIIAWVAFPGDIIARRAFRGPVTLPRGDISHPALVPWSQDWVWSAQPSEAPVLTGTRFEPVVGSLLRSNPHLEPTPRHRSSQNRWKRNTTTKLFLSAVFTRKNALEQKNELGFHWSNLTKVPGGLIFFFCRLYLWSVFDRFFKTDLLLQTMISMLFLVI